MSSIRIFAVSSVHLRDLSISLSAGEHRDVDYTTAKASAHLRHALNAGHVRMRRIETRTMTPKKKPPETRIPALGVFLHSPHGARMQGAPRIPQPITQMPPAPSPQDLSRLEGMVQNLQDQVSRLHLSVPADVMQRIQDVIREAMPQPSLQAHPVQAQPVQIQPVQAGPADPVFVPKDIGQSHEEARVTFKEETAGDGGVQEAVKSLRKMRGK